MQYISFFRFSVFGIWALTLLITIVIFVWSMVAHEMKFSEVEDPMTLVMGILTPQLSVMVAFFFGMKKQAQEKLIKHERSIANLAVTLSIIYHVSFWIVLILSVGLGYFGDTIDENTSAVLKIVGFLSLFGLSPIAYLFTHTEKINS